MTLRCSESAAERGDPMVGTAPPQRDWLLVEHHGPWPVRAPFDTELSVDLLRRLGHPEQRVVLVRPHVRERTSAIRRRWFRCRDGELRTGHWERPEDLLEALRPEAGAPHGGSLLLVCTHGVHDTCCAVSGRPVAAALSQRWPAETFECSHLGGDRFAPNLLLLPDLACYAQMSAEGAVSLVEAHLDGRIQTGSLRGVAGLHPAEQVALTAALERWGPAPLSAARARLVHQAGTLDDGRWTVDVAGTDPLPTQAQVVVASSRRAEARLTCRATRATRALQWDVVSWSTATLD